MTAKILDGKELAQAMRAEVAQAVADFRDKWGTVPNLAVVRAGEDPASMSYARAIARAFERAGMVFNPHVLPESASQEDIANLVAQLSMDPEVHGIMIQEPLPEGVDSGQSWPSSHPPRTSTACTPRMPGSCCRAWASTLCRPRRLAGWRSCAATTSP